MATILPSGGKPVHPSEQEVVARLAKDLPADYRLLPNQCVPDPAGHSYEYDVIVVAPHAVYVVEIKAWRGSIRELSNDEWQLGSGRVERNPLLLADQKARVLSSLLRNVDPVGRRSPYVQACLVVAGEGATFDIYSAQKKRCLLPEKAAAYLRDPAQLDRPAGDWRTLIPQICSVLKGQLKGRQPAPRLYGSYRAGKLLQVTDQHSAFEATHAHFQDGRIYRIRTWYLSPYLSAPERAERLRLLRRSAEALHRVGEHPNIATLHDFGEQEAEFYEVTDWTDRGSLATAFVQGRLEKMSSEAQQERVLQLGRGLEAAFRAGVAHRNLCPEVVLWMPDDSLKITDFDRSYLEHVGSTQTVYAASVQAPNPFAPPELRDPQNYEVYDNSDLYSLAKMALQLFTKLPASTRSILSRCVLDAPDQRPENPTEFLKDLGGPAPFGIGSIIDGNFRIDAELTRTAGAVLYRVTHLLLGEEQVLKLLHAGEATQSYRLLHDLRSDRVVRMIWAGKLPDGRSYLVMERLDGPTLKQLAEDRALQPDQALQVAEQLLEALDALHPRLLHRDIKPENLIWTDRGLVLVDPGSLCLATAAGSASIGTLRYTPFDLADGGWDTSADLFAVGCSLYELLARTGPWGEAAPSVAAPVPLGERLPNLPSSFAAWIDSLVLPRRGGRPASVAEARAALARRPTAAPMPLPAPGQSPWSARRVQSLIDQPSLPLALAAALAELVAGVPSGALGEERLLQVEQQLAALENPLPELLGSTYDQLLLPLVPTPLAGSPLLARPPGVLVLLEGLHPTEWEIFGEVSAFWCAGGLDASRRLQEMYLGLPKAVDVTLEAFSGLIEAGVQALRFHLPTQAADLPGLLERRREILRGLQQQLRDRPHWLVVGTGAVYLGHGLRRGVGEGGPQRPTRREGDKELYVARLSMPDGAGAPLLRTGGLSLPERILPVWGLSLSPLG